LTLVCLQIAALAGCVQCRLGELPGDCIERVGATNEAQDVSAEIVNVGE
jgi:hypothetical protein